MTRQVGVQYFTRDSLAEYLNEHKRNHPEKGEYLIELRHFIVAKPPNGIQHDDHDQVVILGGEPWA